MYAGITKWAPVSPPVVVVLESNRLRCSCHSVTAMTPTMTANVAAFGSQLGRRSPGVSTLTGGGAPVSATTPGSARRRQAGLSG